MVRLKPTDEAMNVHAFTKGMLPGPFSESLLRYYLILQVIRTSKDSPRQTLSSARTLQALHKNFKQTCETQQTTPLVADCTPMLKSAFAKPPKNYRTKNLNETRVHSVILSLSLCKLVTCKNESYLPLHERGMPLYTLLRA